jgi:4-aminobutyrate aminotransferase-like enzyme
VSDDGKRAVRVLDVGCGIHEKAGEASDRVVSLAFERGLLALGAGDNTIRLCPPLTITRSIF